MDTYRRKEGEREGGSDVEKERRMKKGCRG